MNSLVLFSLLTSFRIHRVSSTATSLSLLAVHIQGYKDVTHNTSFWLRALGFVAKNAVRSDAMGVVSCLTVIAPYCDSEHQTLDLPRHHATCLAIKRCWFDIEQIEDMQRNCRHVLPIDAHQPRGWYGMPWSRTTWLNLTHALSRIKHVESVHAQLGHFMDMLELCGYNYAGEWAGIPALMLCIDKDQECYDFVKWWHTVCESYGYNVVSPNSLWFNIEKADAFERLDQFCSRFANTSYHIALTLLKVKLLLELKRLDQVVFALGATFPREILEMILSYVPRNPVVPTNRRSLNDEAHQKLIHGLEEQVDILFREVNKRDPVLWWKVTCGNYALDVWYSEPPTSRHKTDAMALSMTLNYAAWIEIPGATEFIKAKLVDSLLG